MIRNHLYVDFPGVLPSPEGGNFLSWARIIGPRVSNEVCMYGSKKDTGCPTAKVWESLIRETRWQIFLGGSLLASGGLSHWLTVKKLRVKCAEKAARLYMPEAKLGGC